MKTYVINVHTTFTLDMEIPANSAEEALKAAEAKFYHVEHYGNIFDANFQVYTVQDEEGNDITQKEKILRKYLDDEGIYDENGELLEE